MRKTNITILGAGNMATALAFQLGRQGHKVALYCIEPDVLKQINQKSCNQKYLKGVKLPNTVRAEADIATSLRKARVVIMAVPSHVSVAVIKQALPHLRNDVIVTNISKGLDPKTLEPVVLRISNALTPLMQKRVCMLGGPAVANEMVKGAPTAFIVGCGDSRARKTVADLLRGGNVKVAESSDLLGVGMASALKNAYAIALGFCDGLEFSTNSKAFVVTLAVSEMTGMLLKAGAQPKTAPSLAGLGDLLVTGFSPHGRNRQYGEALVHARTNDPKKLGLTTVEGIFATEIGAKLSKRLKTRTPLLDAINKGIHARSGYHKPFVKYLDNLQLGLI